MPDPLALVFRWAVPRGVPRFAPFLPRPAAPVFRPIADFCSASISPRRRIRPGHAGAAPVIAAPARGQRRLRRLAAAESAMIAVATPQMLFVNMAFLLAAVVPLGTLNIVH